ncbi:hypothetical protein EVAR_18155_1 [Eumeta japonica]|uniref:Uncharacterized protein n=1 Tax=Eumeta variegata TaxID=151549 RepID=A0A4C1UWG4_EUMVA|nr:hypothetical protein EVAR_18155_1 [Eumeta japonica]
MHEKGLFTLTRHFVTLAILGLKPQVGLQPVDSRPLNRHSALIYYTGAFKLGKLRLSEMLTFNPFEDQSVADLDRFTSANQLCKCGLVGRCPQYCEAEVAKISPLMSKFVLSLRSRTNANQANRCRKPSGVRAAPAVAVPILGALQRGVENFLSLRQQAQGGSCLNFVIQLAIQSPRYENCIDLHDALFCGRYEFQRSWWSLLRCHCSSGELILSIANAHLPAGRGRPAREHPQQSVTQMSAAPICSSVHLFGPNVEPVDRTFTFGS